VCDRMRLAPVTIHQPYYNMLSRGIERDLLPQTERAGTGVIAFCPLASGLLTDKYLGGNVPAESRAAEKWGEEWLKNNLSPERRERLLKLNEIAKARGQSLAQMALAWILRLPSITSALIGASRVEQVEENVRALDQLGFSEQELTVIETALA
jgi:L-glyceraldehyde 3-phosphate reductase